MKIRVRDNLGNDVTNDREWYVNTSGKIFYYTGDIDGPLYVVDNDYTWEVTTPECGYMYYLQNIDDIKKNVANYDRIMEAVESTKKYIKEV
jgi:hypothetical protein